MKIPNWLLFIDKILNYLIDKITYIIVILLIILIGFYCQQELRKDAVKQAVLELQNK